jgi:flagellar basal-body rod modification protein FlgD
MSSINTDQTGATTSTGAQVVNPSTQMNENSFLQLLVAQLKYQDPMSPTDDQSFIQEQAQFSTVEGLTNLESTLTAMNSSQTMSESVNLIGTTVDYTNADGSTGSGLVSSVSNDDGTVSLQVGSASVDPSTITKVSVDGSTATDGTGTVGSTAGA